MPCPVAADFPGRVPLLLPQAGGEGANTHQLLVETRHPCGQRTVGRLWGAARRQRSQKHKVAPRVRQPHGFSAVLAGRASCWPSSLLSSSELHLVSTHQEKGHPQPTGKENKRH